MTWSHKLKLISLFFLTLVLGLGWSNFSGADLSMADMSNAYCGYAAFARVDLSVVKGLESVVHAGPSTIGIDTLIRSQGKIPENFFAGAVYPRL